MEAKIDWWDIVCENTSFVEDVYFPKSIKRKKQWETASNNIKELLQLEDSAKILELCCGTCAIGVNLAKNGYIVTGIDQSNKMLEYAQKRAIKNGVYITLEFMDLLNLRLTDKYDSVLLIDSTFGSIGSHVKDDLNVLQLIYKILNPNGKLLLEIYNLDYFIKNRSLTMKGNGFSNNLLYDNKNNQLLSSMTIDGLETKRNGTIRLYSYIKLKEILNTIGFNSVEQYNMFENISSEIPSYFIKCIK